MKTTYAIFGLGRYGLAVAKELTANGADVIAVDIDEDNVRIAANYISVCKCADVTDPQVIDNLGISNVDVVIVSMASNLEASVMAVTLCKEVGVKTVIAKCSTPMHEKILKRIGADKVVIPENESGIRLAKNLLSAGFVDMVDLSDDITILEMDIAESWAGKTLIELNLRKKYSINVVGIRSGDNTSIEIDPTRPLDDNVKLIIIAHNSKIKKLLKDLKK